MSDTHIIIEKTNPLSGVVPLSGAKNAVLVIMASLILVKGQSKLTNVPFSDDVLQMIALLRQLGATVQICRASGSLEIDTSSIDSEQVSADIMKKMRASILVMGPLLARFGKAHIAVPGGCVIGVRPIDYHLKNFRKMGVDIKMDGDFLHANSAGLKSGKFVLEYPSVGATENIMMAATLTPGITRIVNAALEPEVLDLVAVLRKMGAHIEVVAPGSIVIEGVSSLRPIEHCVLVDRLEAGSLLLAAAVSGGMIHLPNARASHLDTFLMKLREMGHDVVVGDDEVGIMLSACPEPRAVSFKTAPYPGFPTDLQAPMMAAQVCAQGTSIIEETVFENRLIHVRELQKMGAQIQVDHNKAVITGVRELYGAHVIASDIRAASALIIAGLFATGKTVMSGVHHLTRGYDAIEKKLTTLGASVTYTQVSGEYDIEYEDIVRGKKELALKRL